MVSEITVEIPCLMCEDKGEKVLIENIKIKFTPKVDGMFRWEIGGTCPVCNRETIYPLGTGVRFK